MTVLYKGSLKQNNDPFHVTLLSKEHRTNFITTERCS